MAGFSSVAGEDSVSIMFADNASFDGTERNGMDTDGQLWIGSATAPQVRKGTITSMTLTVGYSDPNITIEMPGGGSGVETFNVDVGPDVEPDVNGVVNVTGGQVFSSGNIANTLRLNVEATSNTFLYGQGNNTAMAELGPLTNGQLIIGSTGAAPVAASLTEGTGIDITPGAGSITIAVDVTEIATIPTSFATDSGTATPAANTLTIAGGPGITTSGSGSTVTINSVVFTDTTATTLAVDNGYFATAAGTYNLPATPAQGELIHIIADTAGAVVVDAPAGDFIRIGNVISSSGGTATSNAIGDQLLCRFRFSTQTWHCIPVGTWTVA